MNGQWSLEALAIVLIEEVIATIQVLAVQLPIVSATIRLTATIASASASLYICKAECFSRITRRREKVIFVELVR